MNNVSMGGMNTLGGPVGGNGMPMMNNGAPGGGPRPQMALNESQRSQLNTYIYDYFLRYEMYDCARALYQNDQTMKVIKESPGRQNGGDDGDDGESKDEIDKRRPDDLPRSDVPRECPESCFLYEWWCLFWDMFNAQRTKGQGTVHSYVAHTQQTQSRNKQEQQANMLRTLRATDNGGNMMPAQYQQMIRQQTQQLANGMSLNQNELRQKAMQNSSNRNGTPSQQMMMQKQQQMQRDPSGGDHQQRVGSPGSADNAPSPSKRARIDGAGAFNPQQQLPNGRGQTIPQQFQNMPAGANPQQQARVAGYQANLAQQQAGQSQMQPKGMPPAGGPLNAGSPMMPQGQDGTTISGYYNAGEMGQNGNMRGGPAGQQPGAAGGGNHALQDYQMQLMLLEQQNKKRLMMARQEQDNMAIPGQSREGAGPGGMGPNGQPFPGTSPQGSRSVNSPNPSEQMKRTPHMNSAGIPSPNPDGQARDSPNNMNFNMPGGQMDPNMNPQYFMKNGMDPNAMVMANGMRPPSSHPPGFSGAGSMTPNQMAIAQQAQQQRQHQAGNWQPGPNGQMMPGQGPPQPGMAPTQGTPQQRPMAPPAAPGVVPNGRTQTSSPQQNPAPPTPGQNNKPNPKKKNDAKDNKAKRAAAKKGAPNTGATPSADSTQEPATPTPATPITPVHAKSFNNGPNGAVQSLPNGQVNPAMNAGVNVPLQDPLQNNFIATDSAFNFDFTNENNGDVLQDFDFDSFLHNDGDNDNFNFDTSGFLDDSNQIGAE